MAARLGRINAAPCRTGADIASLGREFALVSVALMREAAVESLLDAFAELVLATPVATGRARAGWRLALTDEAAAFVPGHDAASIAAAAAAALPDAASLTAADVVHVVNNVGHILALNAGWSRRLPGGFIDSFILALADALDRAAQTASVRR